MNIVTTDGLKAGFINTAELNNQIMEELTDLHSEWAGVAVEPQFAFGLRVYRDGNVLLRHVDRVETHVISSILHIDRQQDGPWPIVISDNAGVDHSVELLPGEMLFYESAKLPHERPARFRGEFYSSLFIHYRPVGWKMTAADVNSQLPVGWDRGTEPYPPPHNEL